MSEGDVLDIIRSGMWITLMISAPVMLIGLVTGLVVALFQALTQIQEMTLAFVPKIIAIFVALGMMLPWMGHMLMTYTHQLMDKMVAIG